MITGWARPNHSRPRRVVRLSCQKLLVRRKAGAAEKLDAAAAAIAAPGVAGSHPCSFSRSLRASRSYCQRSCDLRTSKQTAGTAQSIWGQNFWPGRESPMFAGVRGENLARERSRRKARFGPNAQSCLLDAIYREEANPRGKTQDRNLGATNPKGRQAKHAPVTTNQFSVAGNKQRFVRSCTTSPTTCVALSASRSDTQQKE